LNACSLQVVVAVLVVLQAVEVVGVKLLKSF
jgi:hypothetical protein